MLSAASVAAAATGSRVNANFAIGFTSSNDAHKVANRPCTSAGITLIEKNHIWQGTHARDKQLRMQTHRWQVEDNNIFCCTAKHIVAATSNDGAQQGRDKECYIHDLHSGKRALSGQSLLISGQGTYAVVCASTVYLRKLFDILHLRPNRREYPWQQTDIDSDVSNTTQLQLQPTKGR